MKKVLITVLAACMLMQLSMPAVFAGFTETPILIYVSPDGNDDNAGTIDAPFKTPKRAVTAIRQLKANMQTNAEVRDKGVVVYFRGGTYEVVDSLMLTSQDSGFETGKIVYRSYPGEKAEFVGGIAISPSEAKPIADEAVKNRIIDTSARNKVLSINIGAKGIAKPEGIYLPGAYTSWVFQYGNTKEKWSDTRDGEFFVDGKSQTIARFPNNDGHITINNVIKQGPTVWHWSHEKLGQEDYVPENERDPYDGFIIGYSDERIDNWVNAKDLKLYGYWQYEWGDQTVLVETIDPEANTIESKYPSIYGVRVGGRYYAYNLIEEIDVPGEYYIDYDSGMLYFYPPESYNNNTKMQFSVCEDLIKLKDASYIEIKDIKLSSARGYGIEIVGGNNIKVVGCEITNTADNAIFLDSKNSGIYDCHMFDVNGGVAIQGGDQNTLTGANNVLENCEIERFQRLDKSWNGAVELNGVENRVAHNEIHDAPTMAIYPAGNNNILEYNELYDVIQDSDDNGSMYTSGNWAYRGTIMRYNYMHDIQSKSTSGVVNIVLGIYMDNISSGFIVAGNVFKNIPQGVFIHGGGDNIVYNNMFIDVPTPMMCAEQTLAGSRQDHFNNLAKVDWDNDIWKNAYPSFFEKAHAGTLDIPRDNVFENNLVYESESGTSTMIKESQALTTKGNVLTSDDIGFVDAENGNYQLKEDAEIFEIMPEFEPLPFTRMGRYDERALARVDEAVVLGINSPYSFVEGKKKLIDSQNPNVSARIINDLTYVPLRFIAEAFGAKVNYDGATADITIELDDTKIEMNTKSSGASVNGEAVELAGAPQVIDGRTLIPLRSVTQLMGKQVFWDNMGFVAVSNEEYLFNPEADKNIIRYLYDRLDVY